MVFVYNRKLAAVSNIKNKSIYNQSKYLHTALIRESHYDQLEFRVERHSSRTPDHPIGGEAAEARVDEVAHERGAADEPLPSPSPRMHPYLVKELAAGGGEGLYAIALVVSDHDQPRRVYAEEERARYVPPNPVTDEAPLEFPLQREQVQTRVSQVQHEELVPTDLHVFGLDEPALCPPGPPDLLVPLSAADEEGAAGRGTQEHTHTPLRVPNHFHPCRPERVGVGAARDQVAPHGVHVHSVQAVLSHEDQTLQHLHAVRHAHRERTVPSELIEVGSLRVEHLYTVVPLVRHQDVVGMRVHCDPLGG